MCKLAKLRCFLEKFTQLTKILHDRRSRRSRQIPSLEQRSCCWQTIGLLDHQDAIWISTLEGEKWGILELITWFTAQNIHLRVSFRDHYSSQSWSQTRRKGIQRWREVPLTAINCSFYGILLLLPIGKAITADWLIKVHMFYLWKRPFSIILYVEILPRSTSIFSTIWFQGLTYHHLQPIFHPENDNWALLTVAVNQYLATVSFCWFWAKLVVW